MRTSLGYARARTIALSALTAGVLVVSLVGPVAANPSKGAPSPIPAPTAKDCSLKSSGHKSNKDEWASCLNVTANLSSAPAVGETATLTFDVASDLVYDAATISVDLPSNLVLASAPAGMHVLRVNSADPAGATTQGVMHQALQPNRPLQYQATVTAVAPGPAEIVVRTTGTDGQSVDAGADSVFLTVGQDPGSSQFGIDTPAIGDTAPVPAGASPTSLLNRKYHAAPIARPAGAGKVHVVSDPGNPGSACAVGYWSYQDQNGTWRPSVNLGVWAYDDNSVLADGFLGNTTTDGNGHYSICFNNAETGGIFDSGTVDLYVQFITENSLWRVRQTGTNSDYVWQTGTAFDIPDGNHDFGSLTTGDATLHRGLHAFDEVNDAWFFIGGGCWDPGESPCRQVVVNWSNSSVDGTYYSTGGNDVHLAADDPNAAITVVHETGHAIMDDNYNDAFPSAPNCNPHSIPAVTSQGCAWTEGWAEWFPASVYNDPFYRWPSGASENLETPTWGTGGWGTGDSVEGRIAGAMIDISDSSNEAYWDRYGEGKPGNQWTTFINHISNVFGDFWNQRAGDGFNVAASGALADVYQNTIDYGFRDPLGNYVGLNRPTPSPNNHNYSYNTSIPYWTVVAVRPPVGADYDLNLYDDFGMATLLTGSAFGGNAIDFVAVDSNRRAFGDYYPRVLQFAGTGNYDVELAQGALSVSPDSPKSGSPTDPSNGTQGITMGAGDVVAERDTFQSAGVPVFVRVVPANGGQDAEVFLMGDDPGNSTTWYRYRGNAVAGASATGPGGVEAFSYTPAFSEWYGLVLLNKAGSGAYSLYVDTTAPTGGVSIDGGAIWTNSTSATLDLSSASDPETGVSEMRISTDGVMDSETYVPYSASAGATLPAGAGTKTVLVQFRNNAGMASSVFSDTIGLDTAAPTGAAVTGPGTFLKKKNIDVTWTASDSGSGVATYDVSYRVAPYNANFGAPILWQNDTAATNATLNGAAGNQYCFSVVATDAAGNASAASKEKCSIVPMDDPALTPSAGFTQTSGSGYYLSTISRSSTVGATLTSPTLQAKRIAVLVTLGPSFGSIRVLWNGVSQGTFSLNAGSTKKKQWIKIPVFGSVQTGTLVIRVQSGSAEIDGLAVGRK